MNMPSEELVLQWSNHGRSLSAVFKSLRGDASLADCTVAAEGQCAQAHRLVLSACSPYFELLFKAVKEKHPVIILSDVKFGDLKAVLDFMYCGEVRLPNEQLGDFLRTAECLQVKELMGANDVLAEHWSDSPEDSAARQVEVGSCSTRKRRTVGDEDKAPEYEFVAVDNIANRGISIGPSASAGAAGPVAHNAAWPLPPAAVLPLRRGQTCSEKNLCFSPKVASADEASIRRGTESAHSAVPGTHVDSEAADVTLMDDPLGTEMLFHEGGTDCDDISIEDDMKPLWGVHDGISKAVSAGPVLQNSASPVVSGGELPRREAQAQPQHKGVQACLQKKYSCEVCHKAFRAPNKLKVHMLVHSQEPAHKCSVCEVRFTEFKSLKRHERMHITGKIYKCGTCGDKFTRPASLVVHERSHSGEKPFRCEVCGNRFSDSGNLHKHRKVVHQGEKRYACSECGMRFGWKSGLIHHHEVKHRRAS